jgi:Phytanoyl-CoA dioxygenase (PhyH)
MCLRCIIKQCPPAQDGSAHSHRHLGCAGRRYQGEWWAWLPETLHCTKWLTGMQLPRTVVPCGQNYCCCVCIAGCLWTWPGSHKPGVHRRFKRKQDDSVWFDGEQSQYDTDKFVPLEVHPPSLRCSQRDRVHVMLNTCVWLGWHRGWCASRAQVKAGTLVLLHGANVHFSHENTSPHSRHAYRCGPDLRSANVICVLPSKLDKCCEVLPLHCSMHVVDSGPAAEWSSENWCLNVLQRRCACAVVIVKSILSTTPCFPLVQAAAFP